MLALVIKVIRFMRYASLVAVLFTPAVVPAILVFIASYIAPYVFIILSLPNELLEVAGTRAVEAGKRDSFEFWKALDIFWSTIVIAGGWIFVCTYFIWSTTSTEWSSEGYAVVGAATGFLAPMAGNRAIL